MATVKLNAGGKVLTKGGKVSCGCCEICCMYPAAEIGGLITINDLPNEISISGFSFLRSGVAYGNTTNGIIAEDDVWARYSNGSRSERICLIGGAIQDLFLDSYQIDFQITSEGLSSAAWDSICNGGAPSNTTASLIVTRVERCLWVGEVLNAFNFSCGISNLRARIFYSGEETPGFGSTYIFVVDWYISNPKTGAYFISDEGRGVYKKNIQASPVGIYSEYAGEGVFDSGEWIVEVKNPE